MDTLLDIGSSLRLHRRARGVSQRELAETLGTSQQQIARWEACDYRSASLERVAAAASALGVHPDEGLVAAAVPVAYRSGPRQRLGGVAPARDLGEIAARLRSHSSTLHGRYRLDRIGVFGSFATGDQRPESDVDLLVETTDPGGMQFVQAVLFLEDLLGRPVDLVRPELLRDRLRARVAREVVYVWEA